MPKDYPRALRVGEQLRRELATLLREEVKDPRIGMVTIADVEVSRDLSHAKVFFTVLGKEGAAYESERGLKAAAGYLRGELGRRLRLRGAPELRFIYDETERRAERVDALIDRARAKDKR